MPSTPVLAIKKTSLTLAGIAAVLALLSISGKVAEVVLATQAPHPLSQLVRLFNINREASVPTWYATILLLTAAGLLALIAYRHWHSHAPYRLRWVGLAVVFLYLSMDEASAIHEKLTIPLQDAFQATGYFYFAWIVVGIPLVMIFAVVYLRFWWHLPAVVRNRFLLAGLFYIGGAIGIEAISANKWYLDEGSSLLYSAIGTVEELCEMLGVITFIYALLVYMGSTLGMTQLTLTLTQSPQQQLTSNAAPPIIQQTTPPVRKGILMHIKSARFMDTLSFVFSLSIIGLVVAWQGQRGVFDLTFLQDSSATWYLIRSSGITAYILLTLSVLWGLALSSRVLKDWSPGSLSMTLHSAISWLALAFTAVHVVLLLFDDYLTYLVRDIVIPFTGPYRPVAVGLGTLALWLMLIVTPSFMLRNRLLSPRLWKLLHYSSYAAFLLVTVHALAAGTDAGHQGFQVFMMGSVLLTVILLGYRLGVKQHTGRRQRQRQ